MNKTDWTMSCSGEYVMYEFGRFRVTYVETELNEVDELVRGDWQDVTDDYGWEFDYSKPEEEYY